MKLRYARAVGYHTYRLKIRSSRYDDSVSHYIPNVFKKLRSQMKVHTFNPSDLILILGFLTTFKLACDTNLIHKLAAMWAMLRFVSNCVAASLKSCMGKN